MASNEQVDVCKGSVLRVPDQGQPLVDWGQVVVTRGQSAVCDRREERLRIREQAGQVVLDSAHSKI